MTIKKIVINDKHLYIIASGGVTSYLDLDDSREFKDLKKLCGDLGIKPYNIKGLISYV